MKKSKSTQIRQGDILLERTTHRLSQDAKRLPRDRGQVVLAYGESSAHAHALEGPLTELFEERDGLLYLRVGAPDVLKVVDTGTMTENGRHTAHGVAAATDPTDLHEVTRQREYTPEAIRNVAD